MQRARRPEWEVAFKSIIAMHHTINHGNENFIQFLATSTEIKILLDQMTTFVDSSSALARTMSIYVRRYSRYLGVQVATYRSLGVNFCGANVTLTNKLNQQFKQMPLDRLLTTLPHLQNQFDTLLLFDAGASALNNGIITSAFSMLYRDFVKLYIAYQSAIIRLLGLYFSVTQSKLCQEMLVIYRKFLVSMNKLWDMMRVIDAVGMDKSDMPNANKWPNVPMRLLESHLDQLHKNENRSQQRQNRFLCIKPGTLQCPNFRQGLCNRNPKVRKIPLESVNRTKLADYTGNASEASLASSSPDKRKRIELDGGTSIVEPKPNLSGGHSTRIDQTKGCSAGSRLAQTDQPILLDFG